MCVLFEFRHFLNSSTYFKVSCISLQKKSDRRAVLQYKLEAEVGVSADGEQVKAF